MKKTLLLITALTIGLGSKAQEPADTLVSRQLDEIVIEAPKVIRKADMDIYYPSKSAIENAKNGMQLLTNLMIPSLAVNDIMGSATAAGETVQVRINGRTATIDQVRALLPETIKRVEWIDNPGLRYNGANYVLNVIVANPSVGGSLQTMARPALNQAWGFYFADTKFNKGRSQWDVGGNFKLTNKLKTHRDYTETFTYPGVGLIMPFGKYDQGSRSLSKWNTNEKHMRLDMRMPFIQINYNLQWGHQKRGAQKLVNAEANADQSSAGSR